MSKLVKEVFLLMMSVMIAMTMYYVFFGQENKWEGVLYWSTRQVEVPISSYYYKYCYTPNAHNTDYLDMQLGCRLYGKTRQSQITTTDYESHDINDDSYISYPSVHYNVGDF